MVYGHTIRDQQGFQASYINKWKCGLGLGLPLDGIEAILTETRGPGKSLCYASAHWRMDTPQMGKDGELMMHTRKVMKTGEMQRPSFATHRQ